jgi:hypothetical protein
LIFLGKEFEESDQGEAVGGPLSATFAAEDMYR